jgi:hypothetical protein
MATPSRGISSEPARTKRPKGRFWIGKSVFGALAEATQLRKAGSCVASGLVISRHSGTGRRQRLAQHPQVAHMVGQQQDQRALTRRL